jgi:acetyl-CoA synthetase
VPGRRIAILGADGAELPAGTSGEIALAADDPIVMLGYFGRPDLTARKIVDGWVRLGDRGSIDADGFLRFEGRLDDLIKVSGIQVGAEEVEGVLLEHPAVAEAGVCGVPRADGNGDTVAAFVRLRAGATVDPAELQELVRGRIGRHATPWVVEVVDGFPMTSSGKIQRRELRRAYEARGAVG